MWQMHTLCRDHLHHRTPSQLFCFSGRGRAFRIRLSNFQIHVIAQLRAVTCRAWLPQNPLISSLGVCTFWPLTPTVIPQPLPCPWLLSIYSLFLWGFILNSRYKWDHAALVFLENPQGWGAFRGRAVPAGRGVTWSGRIHSSVVHRVLQPHPLGSGIFFPRVLSMDRYQFVPLWGSWI